MRILIIHCLPNEYSFTRKLKNAFVSGLLENQHTVEEIDIIQNKFDPLLYIPSHDDPTVMLNYRAKIESADIIALAYPCWWNGMPALMKGFFDRVFVVGFAFRYNKRCAEGLLKKIKAAYVISSMSIPFWKEFINYFGARSFFCNIKGILHLCGIKNVRRIQAYGITKTTPNTIAQIYLQKAKAAGRELH